MSTMTSEVKMETGQEAKGLKSGGLEGTGHRFRSVDRELGWEVLFAWRGPRVGLMT